MFTLSPAGYVLQIEQASLPGLIGRQPIKSMAVRSLTGQTFETEAPGKFDLGSISGDRGTIDCVVEAGALGTVQPIFEIVGVDFPSAFIRVSLSMNNFLFAEISDPTGSVVASSDLAAPSHSVPAGTLIHFRLAWDRTGGLPDIMQSNSAEAYLNVCGTRPGWTASATWGAWKLGTLRIGFDSSGNPFRGVVRRFAYSPILTPDAIQKTWSWPSGAFAAPTVASAIIAHLGSIAIVGTGMTSVTPALSYVEFTGSLVATVTKGQILEAGGTFTATSVVVPASLCQGANGTTNCEVFSSLQSSGTTACVMPVDVPVITSATLSEDLTLVGTNFLSRYPDASSIDITAPGAVTLTRAQIVAGGGTWGDLGIVIPAALISGVTTASTCAVTANSQTTAYHAIV